MVLAFIIITTLVPRTGGAVTTART